MFSEVLGIRPWEWERLEARDVLRLRQYIDEQNQEARRGDV